MIPLVRFLFIVGVVVTQLLIVSCTAPEATLIPPVPTSSPTAVPSTPTAAAVTTQLPSSNATTKLNIDELLPPASGRELVLQYCVTCHNIAPIVITRWSREEWQSFFRMFHRARVPVSEADWDEISNYLMTYCAPGRPIPPLPPALLDEWTLD